MDDSFSVGCDEVTEKGSILLIEYAFEQKSFLLSNNWSVLMQCGIISSFAVANTFRNVHNCNETVYLVQTTHSTGNSFLTYIPPVCSQYSSNVVGEGGVVFYGSSRDQDVVNSLEGNLRRCLLDVP